MVLVARQINILLMVTVLLMLFLRLFLRLHVLNDVWLVLDFWKISVKLTLTYKNSNNASVCSACHGGPKITHISLMLSK